MNSDTSFDKIALLREIMKHQDESRIREVADLMKVETYPAGHALCREGETGNVLFVIGEGHVEVTQKNEEGNGMRRLGEAGRGDLIGEMSCAAQCNSDHTYGLHRSRDGKKGSGSHSRA
jgi:CRP-like cAMP-binding protein